MTKPLAVLVALALAPWEGSAPEGTSGPRGAAFGFPTPRTGTVQGVGFAYPEDPSRSEIAEVTLHGLSGDGLRLDGRYVRVRSIRLEPDSLTRSLDSMPDFRYPPGEEGPERCTLDLSACSPFDAVNVYFHVDRMAREFWRDRMGIDPDFQTDAVVHLAGNGAVADPDRVRLLFRLGDTYSRNAAREDDIIYHEYSHLVTAGLGFRIDTTATIAARAVNEGFADYFAASFTDDPGIGEYLKACTPRFHCQGPEDDPDLRTLDTDPAHWNWRSGHPEADLKYGVCTRYHEGDGKCKTIWMNTADVYVWGMIWGSVLWDLREAVGADRADRLVLESVRRLTPARTTLETAAGALMTADRALFEGAYAEELGRVFRDRGIVPDGMAWVGAAEGPRIEPTGPIYPNPATGWARLDAIGVERVEVFDGSGRRVVVPVRRTAGTVDLDVAGLSPGRYFVRTFGAGSSATRPLVVLR